ncbi:MAG: hypothetical protein CMP56_04055, partial [Flavobacteriales bacterium]|nr:hypothetical protein [Flavobacteriales bacterium]
MSNDSPADITSDITDRCILKCKLELGYEGNIKINERSTDILNRLTNSSAEMNIGLVKYNGDDKKLTHISIIKKSLHKYNGSIADAELLMYHESEGNQLPLIISIPITANNSGGIIDNIIVESEQSPFDFNFN